MRIALAIPAGLPLLAAWVLSSGAASSGWRRGTVAAIDVLALLATAWLWSSGAGSDLFVLFLAASVLSALTFAALTPERDVESLGRLHLAASVSIAALSANALWWSVAAILLSGMLVRQSKERLYYFLPGFAALAGLSLVLAADSSGVGPILITAGLSTWWLVVSREVLRGSPSGLVTRVAVSFTLLVAVCSVLLRIVASMPESPALGAIHALALGALALGALGALGATRITTFLTALALARAGLVLFAQLGGAQGRAPSLMALFASGVSLLLLSAALDGTDTIDDVSNLGSVSRRLVLVLGVLSACSFPPFPGFVAVFPLASALLDRNYSLWLLIAAALHFLLGIGGMRVVARAWDPGGERKVETGVGLAAIGLAIAAILLLSIAPSRFVELARTAALSIL